MSAHHVLGFSQLGDSVSYYGAGFVVAGSVIPFVHHTSCSNDDFGMSSIFFNLIV